MKPASFTVASAHDLEAAAALLRDDDTRAIAGGQSLGPMLNFRAARPSRLVPLIHLAGLQGSEDTQTHITIGAATTHAQIADGRTPDLPGNILARIAAGIAYRAVRTRGTIGGSLCHADPAADWLTTLTALNATLLTTTRALKLRNFVTLPYRTILEPGEILRAIRIPRPPPGFNWGYQKLCRKPGEFAHAMTACLRAAEATTLVLGATGGPPLVVSSLAEAEAALAAFNPVERHLHLVAATRALAAAHAQAAP